MMFWTTIPVLTLVVLCSLWCTHAEETILGVDVYGDTLFSFGFTLPITTAATATAPDTTVTGGRKSSSANPRIECSYMLTMVPLLQKP